jgi:hypothetical protein
MKSSSFKTAWNAWSKEWFRSESGDGWNNVGASSVFVRLRILGKHKMRLVLALIIIIYLVGVGVVLSPAVRSTWNTEPASALAQSVAEALPDALAWPVRAARSATGS